MRTFMAIGATSVCVFSCSVWAWAGELSIGQRRGGSKVPSADRQGVFLAPQSVAGVAVSPDGRSIAVATMAFRR